MKQSILLVLLIIVGCAKAAHDVSYKDKAIKGGDKFILTTGCCGHFERDTVEVIGFIQECVLVKDNTGNQHMHNTKYFKSHVKPLTE